MQFGICLMSVVPCRKEPSSTSEMVTQLLFGESYSVTEQREDWLLVSAEADGYPGWISIKQHYRISEALFRQIGSQERVYVAELIQVIHDRNNNLSFPVSIGARLPFFSGGKISFENRLFEYEGSIASGSKKNGPGQIIASALLFLNSPYLWGGKNPFGIDCSGFTQLVYKLNGYKLPRDASQQVELGEPLNFVEEAEAGDLAFFDNEEGRIVHVGILLDHERIIHASGSVRIDRLDHYGIFNVDTKKYSHMLRVIKRILN
jgi:gamma-D-glutamyl-L-lysine dipeptidyl-peptidase